MRANVFAGRPNRNRLLAVTAFVASACASSHNPDDVSATIPEASIYAEPAGIVRDLGYSIIYVDTNIGTFEALRWRGRRSSPQSGTTVGRADYLVVDVYEDAPSGRLVVSVVAQTVTVSRSLQEFRPYSIRATGRPSGTVRQDAHKLLQALGCERIQSRERRAGVWGPRVDLSCDDTTDA
jgi:hypothetical protein